MQLKAEFSCRPQRQALLKICGTNLGRQKGAGDLKLAVSLEIVNLNSTLNSRIVLRQVRRITAPPRGSI